MGDYPTAGEIVFKEHSGSTPSMSDTSRTREAQRAELALATVAKGTGIALAGRVTGAGLGYAFSVLLARWLGAEDLGLFSLAFTVVTAAMVLGRLALDETLVRFVALYRGEGALGKLKGAVRLALQTSVVGGILVMIILFFSAHAIAVVAFGKPELTWVIRGLACMAPVGNLAMVALASTQGCRVMTYVVLTSWVIVPLLQLALAAVLIAAGSGLTGAVVAAVAAQTLAALLGYRFAARVLPELHDRRIAAAAERARILRFAVIMTALGLTAFLIGWIDILLLGVYVPAYELGLYSAAARTAGLTSFFLFSVNTLFAPTLADLFNRGDLALLERLFKTTTKWAVTVSLPFFLLYAFRGAEVLALFGPKFPVAAQCLAVLAAGHFVNSATGSVGYMLTMSGRQNLALADQVGGVAVAIALSIWLIPRWGVLGAAVAMSVAMAALNLLRLAQVVRLIRLHPYDPSFRHPLLAAAAALGVAAGLVHITGTVNAVTTLTIWVAGFTVVYVVLLVALGLSTEDRLVLDRIRLRISTLRTAPLK
ncbi:MAG: flippase [Candidatus Binatia bacterium]